MIEQGGPQMPRRTFGPAVMATRLAVRKCLTAYLRGSRANTGAAAEASPLVLVALSGGADSLALAFALAHEAPRSGVRSGAIIIDHGLQPGSAEVAEAAAAQARQLGLTPVIVERVHVDGESDRGGPEAAARSARYEAFTNAATATGARAILTAHTHDDQAEQVLLGIARGSGLRSIAGIPARRTLGDEPAAGVMLRPFLAPDGETGAPAITRATTEAACADYEASFWRDPHNSDPTYARVRVRERVLPMLEAELGPGVADALVRTAALAREDADALDDMATEVAQGLLRGRVAEETISVRPGNLVPGVEGLSIDVSELAGLARPVLYRVIRVLAQLRFGTYLERVHTLAIAELVTHWRGQAAVYVPDISVTRRAGWLSFERQVGSPRG
ncbi:tRNA lysidine(34) synthetase TilS [Leucobacter salsicius]|uniref:tRNA lysidine(34) synthetase TilS n=1 Tax=Leucobacter salsicius TaxID=664638 RepID=UPI00034D1695|nr:tRNA lysidine(34) synthetase TilS [Leucobacter salsicius]